MKKILANLSTTQRISILVVAVLVGAGLYALIRSQREGDFKPLFTGLAPEDAAGIVQKLKETGVDYRLPESGGAVLRRDSPRCRRGLAKARSPISRRSTCACTSRGE